MPQTILRWLCFLATATEVKLSYVFKLPVILENVLRWPLPTLSSGLAIPLIFWLPFPKLTPELSRETDVTTAGWGPGSNTACFPHASLQCTGIPAYLCVCTGVSRCVLASAGLRERVSESICMHCFVWAFEWISVFMCEQHLFDSLTGDLLFWGLI